MSNELQQRARKYRSAYAIIRVEDDSDCPKKNTIVDFGPSCPWALKVTIKKIVWTPERAEHEVMRLNKLAVGKDYFYFWQYTRLENQGESP